MILNGKEVAQEIKKELITEVATINEKIGLAVIQIGTDPASTIYVNAKSRLAKEIGYNFEHIVFEENVQENEVISKINELNDDKNVFGVIVQLPIPKHLNTDKIINTINPLKDIDGLTKANMGSLINGNPILTSCTPMGIITLLDHYNIPFIGKHVVIVGRSNLVGKPLISLCLSKDATVTVCHSKTENLANYTKQADILIVAVGKRNLITKDMIKESAVVVDVGINRFENKIYGDVNFEEVSEIASYITPVPGGVGPMTTISLMQNVIKSYKIQKR